jgi:hypothetical protein
VLAAGWTKNASWLAAAWVIVKALLFASVSPGVKLASDAVRL